MIVTLLTDFGTADYFVGAMKGVLLSRDPRIAPVDLTHDIPAHDVHAAAFTLLAAYGCFPRGTVHVAVVDPGVGSRRRPIAVEAGGHRFVGPDNGLFGWVMEREGDARVVHLTREAHFRTPVSATFHGRDVFAPVAAALAAGTPLEALGDPVDDAVRLSPLRPARREDGTVEGSVLHVDHFGNCVTNLTRADLPGSEEGRLKLVLNGTRIRALRRFYADGEDGTAEPFAIWGSAGFLEVVIFRDSAARRLGVHRGDAVTAAVG
ncbi:MAG TPA: SAM-dependent chlorinase/fluorinase [Longimicrobium sp.]|nr:SAM-dependent chlorinase/fluorinase [Longimicrobium sp.]